jgi:TIR domain
MADVLISYASEDRERAGKLASALTAHGWSVWWDRKIIAGQAFDSAIERELESAKSVVVLWSKHSIESEWVKNEASVAAERGVLVPASIDEVKLPLEFRRKQTADLIGWRGDPLHGGLQSLCEGIAAVMGSETPHAPANRADLHSHWKSGWRLAVIVGLIMAFGITLYTAWSWQDSTYKPSNGENQPGAVVELATLVGGTFNGEVISDSKGSSRSDISVTIDRIDGNNVRVTSDYQRIGTVEIALTRTGNKIVNSGGDTPFLVDLDHNPLTLAVDPHGEIAYRGSMENSKPAPKEKPSPKPLKLTVTTQDKADQVEIRTAPVDGLAGRIKVCLQVKTKSGWWKGVGLNERDPTLASQKSDGLRCTIIAPGLINIAYWKAKTLGIHTPVGNSRLDLRQYKDHEVIFTWRTD